MRAPPKRFIDPSIGLRLRELRQARGVSLRLLAGCVGLASPSTLVDYERARSRIPAERLPALAKALQCPLRDFFKPPGSPLPLPRSRVRARRAARPASLQRYFD